MLNFVLLGGFVGVSYMYYRERKRTRSLTEHVNSLCSECAALFNNTLDLQDKIAMLTTERNEAYGIALTAPPLPPLKVKVINKSKKVKRGKRN